MPIRTTRPAVVTPLVSPGTAASVFPPGERRWGTWAWNTSAVTAGPRLDALIAAQEKTGANEVAFGAYPLVGRERVFVELLTKAAKAA